MSDDAAPEFVYRLATPEEWRRAQDTGVVPKRDIDEKDGYIHMSTKPQALETARIHFANAPALLALEISLAPIAAKVKFELAPKRGEAFPHLYDELKREYVTRVFKLDRDGDDFVFGAAL